MPIAAVLLDLGFDPAVVKAVPILARTAGLLAHLAEEREQPLGFLHGRGRGGGRRVRMTDETRPWPEQLELDDAAYREQLAYLLERSPFYREKLAGAAKRGPCRDRRPAADREAGAPRHGHRREPVRRALRREARGDRPHLLHERHDGRAELHSAHRGRSRQLGRRLRSQLRGLRDRGRPADRVDVQRRPLRRGRRAGRVRPHRPDPHPGRDGEHRPAARVDRAAPAGGGGAHAFVRGVLDRSCERPRPGSERVERGARSRRRRAGRRRARVSPAARGRLGRAGDRGDGHRRHRRLALGRVREARRHAPRRARLRPSRADRPRDRARRFRWRTAPPASSCSRT